MKSMFKVFKNVLYVFVLLIPIISIAGADTRLNNLRCEFLTNPLGIDVTEPRLSWEIESEQRGVKQVAYQILVASSQSKLDADEGDLWDSGKTMDDQSVHIRYAGKPLRSKDECFWKVKIWTNEGEGRWSETA